MTRKDSALLRYLSVCSGIEAATVAWKPLGWTAYGFSEIERFPSAVLAHHYPDTPNFGDMNDFKNWPKADIDVLVGGTPCQSFSVAGLRKGMEDPRGNLALVYIAIASRYRPEWLVWENVPGVLSNNEGRDFGSIIGAMVRLGYGIAYRVLDAQYFGVPQRRRRVFVVGYFGDWRRAAEVLFEPQSLRRNPPPSRKKGQGATPILEAGARTGISTTDARAGSGIGSPGDPMFTLQAGKQHAIASPLTGNPYSDHESRESLLVPEVANPLTARMHKGINTTADEGQTPIVVHGSQDPCVGDQALALGQNSGQENAIAFAQNQRDDVLLRDMAVRRLTPLECTRLQGFTDDYFDNVPGRSDSAVYKALGNSMAVPVMRWIGHRIASVC